MLSALTPCGAAFADEVEVLRLAGGLAQLAAVAYLPREGDTLPAQVLVADSETAQVVRFTFDAQDVVTSRDVLLDDLDDGPAALCPLGRGVLLVGGRSISVYATESVEGGQLLQRIRGEEISAECEAIVAGPDRIFALFGPDLYRARYADKLGALRPFEAGADSGARALAMSDRGYLLAARKGGPSDVSQIVYYDPRRHTAEPVVARCEGLNDPIAIAYGSSPAPVERRLYALQADGGIYRIDAALPEPGIMRARAKLLVKIDGAVAMCAGGEGELFVVTRRGEGGGELLRVTGRL